MDPMFRLALGFHLIVSILTALVAIFNMKTLKDTTDLLDQLLDLHERQAHANRPKGAEELLLERLNSTIGRNYSGRE